jgi:glycine/D-amino acid oxidase-like deaminating enzyme
MEQCDVAVVGGGLLGSAIAFYLARERTRVVLLEREELNCRASGQNAGSLHFQLEYRMVEHGDALADQFALSLPLVLEAQRAWRALEDELDVDLEVVQHGGVMVAETDEEVEVLRRKHALERRLGLDTELIGGNEARTIAPYLSSSVLAAGWCPTEGHANPRLVGPAFARAAQRLGAEVRVRSPVERLTFAGGVWTLQLASGALLSAESVVIAAGVWSPQLLALADTRMPVLPIGLSMLVTAASAPVLGHLVQHVGRRISMKQTAEGNVLIGGGWPSKLVAPGGVVELEARPELRFESLTGNARVAVGVVPALRKLSVIRAWSGTTAITPDQVPLLGSVPRRAGLFLATGGAAFTLGPVFARLVAEQMLGRAADVSLEVYSPQRFAHLNAV